jgi:hypothetical protein
MNISGLRSEPPRFHIDINAEGNPHPIVEIVLLIWAKNWISQAG